jgi:hypothetical protein
LYHAAPTPLEKARHLASVVAIEPNHKEAQRELDRLSASLNTDIKPSFSTIFDHREVIDEAVEAAAELEVCPMCAGQTLYIEEDDVKCLSCGYRPKVGGEGAASLREDAPLAQTLPPGGGFRSLREALIHRQYGTGRQWIIAQRVLACQNCGAQLTLSGNMMVDQCAFCDSQHVLVQDAMGAFQEPDAVLTANLNEREALKAVWDSLPSRVRQMAFRHESVGIFLPYWNFRDPQQSYQWNTNEMLVAGSNQPGSVAMEALEPFDLRYLRPYDQRYLASWSAELYTKDAIQASLEISVAHRDNLDYRLLLLPVWMTTIHLRGGEFLHSLVNAQTGKWWSPGGMVRAVLSAPSATQATPRPSESVIKPLPRKK